ncbi:oligosaccharide flippase family protein [Nocardioides plantarum]|uniref:Oligosaccharide flippase family protein n=1 Tax=Nocardioides plantarum TaxID=29299 RepID=A0ABV5K7I8_9ACTN|nr:oligosaccharide flippase family protein [Nocardioides plantarum]
MRALLPADPGRCWVGADPATEAVLSAMLAAARVAEVGWPADGTADLVVVDERRHDVEVAARALAPGGTLAVLGSRGPWSVYPDTDRPELLWRAGWPVHPATDLVGWARRRAGLSRPRGAPHLEIRTGLSGPPPRSLADRVVADLAAATGRPGRLVGVIAAGQTVLRVRHDDGGGDIAVRIRLRALDHPPDLAAVVAGEVPGLLSVLPQVVARGHTAGHAWTASRWVGADRPSLVGRRDVETRRRLAADTIEILQAHPTGTTAPGWARSWADTADQLSADLRAEWAGVMQAAENAVVTAWCHGDLWPGNVAVDGDTGVTLDWDNASPDAPAGLDRLLVGPLAAGGEAHRWVHEVLRHVDEPELLDASPVGGRAWSAWDRPHRLALAVAAVVLQLRNRSALGDGGALVAEAARAVADVRHPPAVVTAAAAEEPDPGGSTGTMAGRTARGALWLAVNGIVVKSSQTVVLLILAAVLAPQALGLVALGTLVANVSVVLSSLGTASALVFWRGDVQRAARTAVTLAIVTGVALGSLIWATAPWLADAMGAEDGGARVIRGLVLTLPFVTVSAVTNELLRRRLAFLRRIIPDTTASVLGAVVAIGLALGGSGVMALVVGQVVQAVATLLLSWCVHPPVRPGWSTADAKGLLSYGGPLAGANLLQLVQLNVDYIVVSVVLGAAALGQYSLAFRLAFMPYLMIAVVIGGAAFPYLCRLTGARLAEASATVMAATVTIVTPVCLGIAMLADHLVLLGRKWSDGVPVVALLAGYAWMLVFGTLAQTSLSAAGRTGVAMGLRLAHLVFLVVGLALVSRQGIVAVGASQLVAATLAALLALWLLRRVVTGFSAYAVARQLGPVAVAAAVMALAMLGLRILLNSRHVDVSAATLVLGAVVGIVAYALPLAALDRDRVVGLGQLLKGGTR